MWYRTHECELENGFYQLERMLEGMRLTSCVLPQGKALKCSCIIVYEMYRLPNIWLTLMLINLRMRFENSTTRVKRKYGNDILLCDIIQGVI